MKKTELKKYQNYKINNKIMDAKKLKTISSELKKASKMHKAQALKIDGMLKSLKTKK